MSDKFTHIQQLFQENRLEEANASCLKLCQQNPGNPRAWFELGCINAQLGNLDKAAESFQHVLMILPRHAESFFNLGKISTLQNRADLAIQFYQKALQSQPDYIEAYNNLGNLYRICGKPSAALEIFQRAARAAQPSFNGLYKIHDNIASTLQETGNLKEALQHYRRALALKPDYAEAHSNLLFLLSYNVLCSPQEMLEESKQWDQTHGARRLFSHTQHGNPQQRLRIGYVSPDLRRHAVSYFLEPILAHHDPQQVEVFCYAEVKHPDEVTLRLQQLSHHWRSTVGMSDEDLAQKIHDDGIHILVDLAGHTANSRLRVFTFKPAPIQVTYLGYFATTGLNAMDYWLSDEVLHPADTTELAVETIYRLPRCCLTYQPDIQTPPVTQRPDGPVVFGSFNQLTKTSPQAVQLWAEVLHAVPDSRLLIKSKQLADATMRETLLARFEAQGIDPARITPMPHAPSLREHLATYGQVDIALDTIPRTGGSTTTEALWMGVPVITLAGERFIERLSASMLNALGLSECVASSREEYIHKAIKLASDYPHRTQLRHTMRQRMETSPLCNSQDLAHTMELAFRNMWEKFIQYNE